ncbi:hypothetical protein [Neobacillus kokaensis]|uniref:Uncharacterized protein n=1 Tax=Neobacillus kokaensis TaxID=2759023 RepID=A0ABQ3NAZ3_9BACI|nr:hypothetical protein [Neobacillus kokaensis]GHI01079.1 hypothetical protein AM1BK_46210 [Neobacillus kokaensis]
MLIGSKKNFIYLQQAGFIEIIDFAEVKKAAKLQAEELEVIDLTNAKELREEDPEGAIAQEGASSLDVISKKEQEE